MTIDILAAAGLAAGVFSLIMVWRQRSVHRRDGARLREETHRSHTECLREIGHLAAEMAESGKSAQAGLELLRDGRPAMPARSRALQMLRSGVAADTAAADLGLARNEVRLLAKVAVILAPRN